MPTLPPPIGLPANTGLAFDTLTLLAALTTLVMFAGLALLLWAARTRDVRTYEVRCPVHGTEAKITVRRRREEVAEVEQCSLFRPPTRVACEKRCLRLVA